MFACACDDCLLRYQAFYLCDLNNAVRGAAQVALALFWQSYVWTHTHLSIFIFIVESSGEDRQDSDEKGKTHRKGPQVRLEPGLLHYGSVPCSCLKRCAEARF